MDKEYELKYHREEEENWWFVSRRAVLLQQLRKYNIAKDAKILDIGSAGGALGLDLKREGYTNVYMLDYSIEAVELCKRRGLENVFQMDGHYPDFPENSFDVVMASDCLEHLENDSIAMKNWMKIVKSKGLMIVYVPAFQFMWSDHDVINHHFRRYTKKQLIGLVDEKSWSIEETGYWNFIIFFPTAVIRWFSQLKSKKANSGKMKDSIVILPKWINSMLVTYMKIENRIMNFIRYPIGVSTYFVGRKR